MTYVTFPAQTVSHTLPDASDASTRAFTLQSQAAANRSRPLRTPPDVVSVYRTNPTQWTQCVHGQPAANRSRTVRASGKIVSVDTALLLQTFNWFYCCRQLAIRIVVSAIAVSRLVDNLLSNSLRIVHWLNYKLDSLANSTRDTGTNNSTSLGSILAIIIG